MKLLCTFLMLMVSATCGATSTDRNDVPDVKAAGNAGFRESLVVLKTRPGVEQKFILLKPEKPVASIILFAGGKGALNLGSFFGATTMDWGRNNFLVRTRERFARQGMMVAVVDAPSDRQGDEGMYHGFRESKEHVQDIDQVIAYLRRLAAVPVWLVGTSRGTESATHLAIHSQQRPDGIVLSSSMSVANRKGSALTQMPLDRILQPALIVQHEQDACRVTPPQGAREIAAKMKNAKRVQVKWFRGGDSPVSGPCNALSYHGFLGIENQVVETIAGFIRSN